MPIGSPGRTLPPGDLWTALFSPPPPQDVIGPFWLLYLLVFAAGFVLSITAEGNGLARVLPHPETRRVVADHAPASAALFGAGLFFFGVRALQIDPLRLAAPFWLVLSLVAAVVYLAFIWLRFRQVVPAAIEPVDRRPDFSAHWPTPARRASGNPGVTPGDHHHEPRRDAERPAPFGAGRS